MLFRSFVKGINEEGKKIIFPSILSLGKDRNFDKVFNNAKDCIIKNLHLMVDTLYFNTPKGFI